MASGSRSPSSVAPTSSPSALMLTVWISLCLAHITLPEASMDTSGSSLPMVIITHPSSYPMATALDPLAVAMAHVRSIP